MDRKTTGAFREGGHDLGVEIAREFFLIAAHELDLDITPGLNGLLEVQGHRLGPAHHVPPRHPLSVHAS